MKIVPSISVFILGFYLSVTDKYISSYFIEIISYLDSVKFWLIYFCLSYFIYLIAKSLNKISFLLKFQEDSSNFEKFKILLNVFFISYFLGILINLGNEMVLIMFKRYILNGGHFVF